MFGTSLICFVWLYAPTRFVTRLTQVRRQAITTGGSASGEVKDFIRFQHGGHLMAWGNMPREREVEREQAAPAAEKPLGRQIVSYPDDYDACYEDDVTDVAPSDRSRTRRRHWPQI